MTCVHLRLCKMSMICKHAKVPVYWIALAITRMLVWLVWLGQAGALAKGWARAALATLTIFTQTLAAH